MSGQKKCIRLQIDFPIDDDCLFDKISIKQIPNVRFKFSINNLKEQNFRLNSYEAYSLGSSVSGYSSASDSLMSSILSNDNLKSKDLVIDQIKPNRNVYDRLSYRKVSEQSMNYSSTHFFKNRIENVYEEIIHDDDYSIEYNPSEIIGKYNDDLNATDLSRPKICARNLSKVYSLSQIMENIENLTECATKQEEMAQFRNSFSSCSESIYV